MTQSLSVEHRLSASASELAFVIATETMDFFPIAGAEPPLEKQP